MNWLASFLLLLIFSGCAGGTEAGNPTNSTNSIPSNAPAEGEYAQAILNMVCSKYVQCYPSISYSYCQLGLLQQTNLPGAFGLSSVFGTAQDMVTEERARRIQADYNRYLTCVSDIQALACSSGPVVAAAPAGSTTNSNAYRDVINMIPTSGTSCAGVF